MNSCACMLLWHVHMCIYGRKLFTGSHPKLNLSFRSNEFGKRYVQPSVYSFKPKRLNGTLPLPIRKYFKRKQDFIENLWDFSERYDDDADDDGNAYIQNMWNQVIIEQ